MADKGLDFEDLLRAKQVSLNLSPFLQSQTQFSAQDVLQTRGTCNKKDKGISSI